MSSEDHPDWWRPTGGQNSQDSILERRSLVWNDNEVEAPDAPPANYTEVIYKGKFYTRGCRGMIEQLQIYCVRAAAGTLQLRYSPHPCLGPIGTVTITPGATWGWVGVDIEEMWNYDSLFIWVYACSADVSWAYDAVWPYDGHWSQDVGATWEDMAIRPFIRVVYTGETPGDVPVSGIINNVELPNTQTPAGGLTTLNVPAGDTLYQTIEGVGWLNYAYFTVRDDIPLAFLCPRIVADGNLVSFGNITLVLIRDQYLAASVEGWTIPVWDIANDWYALQLVARIPFRRSIQVGFSNLGAAINTGYVWSLVELLS